MTRKRPSRTRKPPRRSSAGPFARRSTTCRSRQREVALLSLGEGLPASEVAYILATTEANVYTCLHLARKRIAEAIGVNYSRRKKMKPDEPDPPFDESLESAIRAALEVDAGPERLARLEHFWFVHSRQQLWRGRMQRITAIAATLAAVAALAVAWNRQAAPLPRPEEDSIAVVERRPVDQPRPATQSDTRAIELSAGRPPTAYERLVFIARTKTQSAAPVAAMVNSAIDDLASHPDAAARSFVYLPDFQRPAAETILLRRLARSNPTEQCAVLRLLAVNGTRRSVPAIVRIAWRDELREPALAAVEQIVGLEGLPQVVRSTTDPWTRDGLIRRLLNAGSDRAMFGYLSLVRDEATRTEALKVAEADSQLPIDKLIGLLDHSEQPVRFSAALVLGSVDGPEITRRLIVRVTNQPADSREAWLALLACRGKLADEFFAYASRRPQLLGYVNDARVQWTRMIP